MSRAQPSLISSLTPALLTPALLTLAGALAVTFTSPSGALAQPTSDEPQSTLPKEMLKRVIMSRKEAYQSCYEQQLQLKKDLNGKISILIMVSGSQGNVLMAKLADSSMNNPAVENCIIDNIKTLRFPLPENGKNFRFTYPLRFNPS